LLLGDLAQMRCWTALVSGDFGRAHKFARSLARRIPGPQEGTALWARLAAKLGSHRGTETPELRKEFAVLKSSVGSRPFYGDEQFSLAALLLYSDQRENARETSVFVSSQFQRLTDLGQQIWPFLLANIRH
jgi:glutathione S-transferase